MILIDMNMPQSCQDCPAFGTKACDKWDKHKTFSDQRTKRHKDCPLHESDVIEVLQEIKREIEGNMESVIGKYDSSVPTRNMPSAKIERNEGREECLGIIDKYLEQYKEDAG